MCVCVCVCLEGYIGVMFGLTSWSLSEYRITSSLVDQWWVTRERETERQRERERVWAVLYFFFQGSYCTE